MMNNVFENITILDLSEDVAGSFCARLFADFGANVLKIEPSKGSKLRKSGPFFGNDPHHEKSFPFFIHNLNKKSITLNIETKIGKSIFKDLASRSDLIIESYSPGYLKSIDLGFSDLEKLNPKLSLTSITPFGQTGPYKNYKSSELINYAMSLIMSISGIQGQQPLKHAGLQAEYEGGLFGAGATAMSLFKTDLTGIGEHIDVSITECVASTMMASQSIYPFIGGTQTRRKSEGSNSGQAAQATKDGWVVWQTGGGASWEDISEFFESPELLEPKFADRAQRISNGPEMDEIVENYMKTKGKWELFYKASEARMLFGVAQTPAELMECEQLKSRDFFHEIEHPYLGKVKVPAELFKYSHTPYKLRYPAPTLGQDNIEIFENNLGYSRQQIIQMKELGVI
jgi:crotonobetainyl-CoA:carnitine CoA-transferase CaiB-like acyl-CoA transferase